MRSTLIYFDGDYYVYHWDEKKEQGLDIGGYGLVLLSDLVASYPFDKSKDLLNQTTYHGIYCDAGLMVLKGKKSFKEIKYWLAKFQYIVDKAAGNHHLQFTEEIWKNYMLVP